MRKKLIALFGFVFVLLAFGSCVPKTYAEDNVDVTKQEETTTTEQIELTEEISFNEMLADWLERFLPSIISSVFQAPMLLFVYLFFRKSIKKACLNVINSSILSKEEKDVSLKALNKLNDNLDKQINELKTKVENFEEINKKAEEKNDELNEKMNNLLSKFNVSQELNTKLFSILAIIVSQSSDLCNEGYARQLLELMNDFKKEGE